MPNASLRQRSAGLILLVLLVLVVPMELLCALLAYETIGEVACGIYLIAIVALNSFFIVGTFITWRVGVAGIVLVALAIIPFQGMLGWRLFHVQAEVARIVTYVYERRLRTGAYPEDLAAYRFRKPWVARFVQTYTAFEDEDGAGFALIYRVGSPNASHWYSSRNGWGYYPD